MTKFIVTAVTVLELTVGAAATAQASHGCGCRASASVVAPAAPVPATSLGPSGYRAYSYEPSAPVYRTPMYRSRTSRPSYLEGSSKALGRY